MVAVRIAAFIVGIATVVGTLGSAVRTVVVPRGISTVIARAVFGAMRYLFRALSGRAADYERRDRVMAFYAPLSLLALPAVWLTLAGAGYTLLYWALDDSSLRAAVRLSGSSLLTLGFDRPPAMPQVLLSFTEGAIGIGLLALLITYLPSIYGMFARREAAVALLETRAGLPPWGSTMIIRYQLIGWPGGYTEVWKNWQQWFAEVEESHTSMPALAFFRSAVAIVDHLGRCSARRRVAGHIDRRRRPRPGSAVAHPFGVRLAAAHRRLLRLAVRRGPAARRPHLGDSRGVRRGVRRDGGRRREAAGRPRPGVARFRGLAGQLRRGTHRLGRLHARSHSAVVG
ncbi:MAG: hypothetical protein KY443_08055 [Actinobacteria bacterium]|nr:hypothetical protein [Actinomycetota bacterium]